MLAQTGWHKDEVKRAACSAPRSDHNPTSTMMDNSRTYTGSMYGGYGDLLRLFHAQNRREKRLGVVCVHVALSTVIDCRDLSKFPAQTFAR
uniref:5-formyltetrahydrofolate cyclo-ligase n=1 Tax=Steinernema glaseri TaxID=37863 RepID=A0A1I8AMA1_9BILA